MAESSHDVLNSILSLPRGWSEAMHMTRYHPAYPILWEAPSDRAALKVHLSNLYDPWRFYSWATTTSTTPSRPMETYSQPRPLAWSHPRRNNNGDVFQTPFYSFPLGLV